MHVGAGACVCVCVGCVLARSARAFVRIGVVDGLHTMRAVQWRLTVVCVCACVCSLCWLWWPRAGVYSAVRPDYARFSALMVAYDDGWHRDAPISE